jgi:hypothetical protein
MTDSTVKTFADYAMDKLTFDNAMASILSKGQAMRDDIQAAVLAGFSQYLETGDAGKLTNLYVLISGLKGFSTAKLKGHIELYANVKLRKNKGGESFGKIKPKDGEPKLPASVDEKALTALWYDFATEKKDSVKYEGMIATEKLIKSLAKKIEEAGADANTLIMLDALKGALETMKDVARELELAA